MSQSSLVRVCIVDGRALWRFSLTGVGPLGQDLGRLVDGIRWLVLAGWVLGAGHRLVPAAWAHGGDPHASRPPQIVGRSTVRAADSPLRLCGEIPQDGSAATVTGIMAALEAVSPGAGTGSGSARVVVVLAVPGEGFDWPVEPVASGASDRGGFERPVAGAHREPAPDLGGKPASLGAVFVEVGRAVKEDHLTSINHVVRGHGRRSVPEAVVVGVDQVRPLEQRGRGGWRRSPALAAAGRRGAAGDHHGFRPWRCRCRSRGRPRAGRPGRGVQRGGLAAPGAWGPVAARYRRWSVGAWCCCLVSGAGDGVTGTRGRWHDGSLGWASVAGAGA